jgi:hypothetical protein
VFSGIRFIGDKGFKGLSTAEDSGSDTGGETTAALCFLDDDFLGSFFDEDFFERLGAILND